MEKLSLNPSQKISSKEGATSSKTSDRSLLKPLLPETIRGVPTTSSDSPSSSETKRDKWESKDPNKIAYFEFIKHFFKPEKLTPDDQRKVDQCHERAKQLFKHKDYNKALEETKQALEILQDKCNDYTRIAQTQQNCGVINFEQGKFKEAKEHFHDALTSYIEAGGTDNNPHIARALYRLDKLYKAWGKEKNVIEDFQEKFAFRKNRNLSLAGSLRELGITFRDQWNDKPELAERFLKDALAIERERPELQPDNGHVRKIQYELGVLYQNQGKYEEAKQMLMQIYDREKDHSRLAVLCELGRVHLNTDELGKAEEFALKALKRCTNDHPRREILDTHHLAATVYSKLGKLDKVQEHLEKQLAIGTEIHGSEHPNIAKILHQLADVCEMQGKDKEKREYLARELPSRLMLRIRSDIFKETSELDSKGFTSELRLDRQCNVTRLDIDKIRIYCLDNKFREDTSRLFDISSKDVQQQFADNTSNYQMDMAESFGSAFKWIKDFSSSSDDQRGGMWERLSTRFHNGKLEPGEILLLNVMKTVGQSYDAQFSQATSPQILEQQHFSRNNFTSREAREEASTSSGPSSRRDSLKQANQTGGDYKLKQVQETPDVRSSLHENIPTSSQSYSSDFSSQGQTISEQVASIPQDASASREIQSNPESSPKNTISESKKIQDNQDNYIAGQEIAKDATTLNNTDGNRSRNSSEEITDTTSGLQDQKKKRSSFKKSKFASKFKNVWHLLSKKGVKKTKFISAEQ